MKRIEAVFRGATLTSLKSWVSLIAGLALVAGIMQIVRGEINNYLIFKYVFWHSVEQLDLYAQYPDFYFDTNHYGPVFSIIIAPFAVLPDVLGCLLWNICAHVALVFAVWSLPLTDKQRAVTLLISINVLFLSMQHLQSNALIAALLIWAYVFAAGGRDRWATLMILLGAFVKLYGILGLAFFFYSRNKSRFIGWLVAWSVVLLVLPMLYSSPGFILQSYGDWLNSITAKYESNLLSDLQDVSVLGLLYKTTKNTSISPLLVLVPAVTLISSTFLRWHRFKERGFQLLTLSVALLSVVLFSAGTENATYVIGAIGVGIWYVIQPQKNRWTYFLLWLVIIVSTFSFSDLFPHWLYRNVIQPYSLVALPCLLVWIQAISEQWKARGKAYLVSA